MKQMHFNAIINQAYSKLLNTRVVR